ncbi:MULTISPECIES: hypothetical protein [Hyphobacterium]|uniref:Uncharacterized protein n=1 Tax=Hyphobacterium vulgare TaxID=1736751 RepID=A0ABV6ZVI3_9PROT
MLAWLPDMRGTLPVFFSIFTADGVILTNLANMIAGERIEFEHVRDVLARDANARMVLVAPAPADLLMQRLHTVTDPVQALERTCDDVSAVLKTFRQARRRILLLDYAQCVRGPNRLSAALGAWAEGKSPEVFEVGSSALQPADALAKVVALAMIAGDRQATRLAEEYEASLSTLEAAPESQTELARQAAIQWRAALSFSPSGSSLNGREAWSKPEDAITDLDAQRTAISELQAALKECQDEVTRLYAQNAEEDATNDHNVDHRLSELELERDALRADLAALNVEAGHLRLDNHQLRDALDQIRASTSWKMTAPLRRLRGEPSSAREEKAE